MSDMNKCDKCIHQDVCEKRTCAICDGGGFTCDECEIYNCYDGRASVKNCSDFIDRDNVQEVKHSHWVCRTHCAADEFAYRCALCGNSGSEYGLDKYCNNCGARMDGDNNTQ